MKKNKGILNLKKRLKDRCDEIRKLKKIIKYAYEVISVANERLPIFLFDAMQNMKNKNKDLKTVLVKLKKNKIKVIYRLRPEDETHLSIVGGQLNRIEVMVDDIGTKLKIPKDWETKRKKK